MAVAGLDGLLETALGILEKLRVFESCCENSDGLLQHSSSEESSKTLSISSSTGLAVGIDDSGCETIE